MAIAIKNVQKISAGQIAKLVQLGHEHEKIMNVTVAEANALISAGAIGQEHGPQPYAWKKNTDEKRAVKTRSRK